MTQIHSEADFLKALSQAMMDTDPDMLCDIRNEVVDWLEDRETKENRLQLIDALESAIYTAVDMAFS